MTARVDLNKCTGCAKCVEECPVDAIEIRNGKAIVGDACVACGACVNVCPVGAISL